VPVSNVRQVMTKLQIFHKEFTYLRNSTWWKRSDPLSCWNSRTIFMYCSELFLSLWMFPV